MLKSHLLQSLKSTVPQAVKIGATIKEEVIDGNELGTKYVQITSSDTDVDLIEWTQKHQTHLNQLHQQYGAVLFRGFSLMNDDAFQTLCQSFTTQLLDYTEPSTPRTRVNDKIYTSTEYPKDQFISMHNEHSYTSTWPQKIWFYCKLAATTGGETPISDSALVYDLIPPALRQKFADQGIMYMRNFHNDIDLPWQQVFGTDDKAIVEEHCLKQNISFKWMPNNILQTRYTAQAVVKHPVSGQNLWFNQAHLFNLLNRDPAMQGFLTETFGLENLPRNSYFGNGESITPDQFNTITQAFERAKVTFIWQTGDILWLDNMRFAHGRNPFEGPRKVLVAMSDPFTYKPANSKPAADTAISSARKQTSTFFINKDRPQTLDWLKYRLAGLYRILAMEKLDEGISGHISFKVPGHDNLFWVNPFGLFFEEVTPDNLITVDMAGNVVEGDYPVNVAGFCIHSAIHTARPNIHCIVHTHSPLGTVFTALGHPIEPIDQTSCMFFEKHGIYKEYNGPVLTDDESRNLTNNLSDNHTLLLSNHGTLTLGEEIETAAMLMIAAEHAYHVNLQARTIGKPILIEPDVARTTQQWIGNPLGMRIEFDAYLRKAERNYPDFSQYRPE